MALRIGDLALEEGAVLAPMAGVTDAPFRLLCREQGAALSYTEMISAKGVLCAPADNRAQRDLLHTLPGSGPTALQLFGAAPETVADMVDYLVSTCCAMPWPGYWPEPAVLMAACISLKAWSTVLVPLSAANELSWMALVIAG